MARQFSTGTKFGSEKGKVQKPARIPPQTPPAGGKKAEAGQFHSPRKIVCPAESKLVFRIFVKKCSNFVQKTPHKVKYLPFGRYFTFKKESGMRSLCSVSLMGGRVNPSLSSNKENTLATGCFLLG